MERQMRGSMVESDGDSFEEREVDNSGWHLHIIIYFACFIVDPTQSVCQVQCPEFCSSHTLMVVRIPSSLIGSCLKCIEMSSYHPKSITVGIYFVVFITHNNIFLSDGI
jgi:hypothetical protein